jgi:hypothetical protein
MTLIKYIITHPNNQYFHSPISLKSPKLINHHQHLNLSQKLKFFHYYHYLLKHSIQHFIIIILNYLQVKSELLPLIKLKLVPKTPFNH